ncbi:MAG: hypothetical protein UZ21_OP11001000652 [Microgenomates bacterium OLB22]|nr:MAG: hypothetical protein UZ21_OP11001000652 [Microgenomates bacterium OLB22]
MRMLLSQLCLFLLLFCIPPSVYSATMWSDNNKFGMHAASLSDEEITDTAALVNSSGGAWGYITLLLSDGDYDHAKWQNLFDKLRLHKLIPIVRLTTKADGPVWMRPELSGANTAAHFLNSLNWPTRQRYVVLFNEPNHGHEWGGACDPADYASTASVYAKAFKQQSGDFVMMLAGLDQAAPHQPPNYCDAGQFIAGMIKAVPDLFTDIEAWASHSYANPGFEQSPTKRGRSSIRGYEWELSVLNSLGVTKDLPVFITETGWSAKALSQDTIAEYYRYAFEVVWLRDGRVRAVTPFILSYIGEPFQQFSWRRPEGGKSFFPVHEIVKSIAKTKGRPPQLEKASVFTTVPRTLVTNSQYQFQIWLRNDGQTIWDKRDGYEIALGKSLPFDVQFSQLFNVVPGRSSVVTITFSSALYKGQHQMKLVLMKGGVPAVQLASFYLEVVDPPSLGLKATVFPGFNAQGPARLQIFDRAERLVWEKKDVFFQGWFSPNPEDHRSRSG